MEVLFDNGNLWVPGFLDLGDILSKIGKCEDLKYPFGRGHEMAQEFFDKCFGKQRREIESLLFNQYDPNQIIWNRVKEKC